MSWQKKHLLCIYMDISCGSVCIPTIICMYLFNRAYVIWLVTQPDVVWTNSNVVPTWSAGASSVWDNSSDKPMVISGSTTFQPPTSHYNPFSPRSFPVPLWLMCLTLHMLPLRQEQLTASLAVPQVPEKTQSNRIRVRIWGGGCFCACVRGRRRNIHEVVCFFFSQFMSEEKNGAAARVGWCLGSRVVAKNKTGGVEIGIWGGDSLQSATMVYVPKAEISA